MTIFAPMTRRRLALSAAALAGSGVVAGPLTASDTRGPPGRFRRGAALPSVLGWGQLAADDHARYVREPFAGSIGSVPDRLLKDAAHAGLDFIRLAVDPGPFIQFTGAVRDRLDDVLIKCVARLRRFGFAVIVDIHPNVQIPAYNSYGYTEAVDSAGFKAYAAFLRRAARVLHRLQDADVALELMNEPPNTADPTSTALWQAMLERLHAAARADAPDLTLILAGGQADLPSVDPAPFKASNVLYTFHYYEPHDFTHQGVPVGEAPEDYRRFLRGLPYPARLLDSGTDFVVRNVAQSPGLDDARRLRALKEALAKAAEYAQSGFDRSHIRADFERIAQWAARHDIPNNQILLGEFGVARSSEGFECASPSSAEAWLRDVREEAERNDFGWSVWAMTGGGFMRMTTSDDSMVLDPGVLSALGLRSDRAAR